MKKLIIILFAFLPLFANSQEIYINGKATEQLEYIDVFHYEYFNKAAIGKRENYITDERGKKLKLNATGLLNYMSEKGYEYVNDRPYLNRTGMRQYTFKKKQND